MNETIRRFGWPATSVAEYGHWLVVLRRTQPTLASLVLAAKSEATAFGALGGDAFAELGQVVADIEATLADAVQPAKINYLMLMLVDPHVHFHVIPRYEGERSACGVTIADSGWPRMPALSEAEVLTDDQVADLAVWLKGLWPKRRRAPRP